MKQRPRFLLDLEKYLWKLGMRSPLPYSWIVIGLIVLILLTSLLGSNLGRARSRAQAIELAVSAGDYALAEQLYLSQANLVLGASTELEDLVYPEQAIERRVNELEAKLEEYPGNREIYFLLSNLYGQLGNQEMSDSYQEKARILDPNR